MSPAFVLNNQGLLTHLPLLSIAILYGHSGWCFGMDSHALQKGHGLDLVDDRTQNCYVLDCVARDFVSNHKRTPDKQHS